MRTIQRRTAAWLSVLALAGAGAPVRADDIAPGAGPSLFSHNYEGRLETLIREDQVLEVFKVRNFRIFYIEFQSTSLQSQSLDRIGVFVESDAYHGKILAPERMGSLSADALFDAHDYAGEDVARFYTQAAVLAIRLDPMEERLKQLLLRLGVLAEREGRYLAPQPAAILATVAGMDERHGAGTRRWVLDHEFRHGYYFVALKDEVHEVWRKMLSDREREMIAATLQMTARYNPDDPSLMEREFHAMAFESRFEDDLRRLAGRGLDGRARATPAELERLVDKLPVIRLAFLELEERLLSRSRAAATP